MKKSELIGKVAEKTQLTLEEAEKSINALLSSIGEALCKGDKVNLIGFGSFSSYERPSRIGYHPKTGEKIRIPARKIVKFKAGKKLIEKIK